MKAIFRDNQNALQSPEKIAQGLLRFWLTPFNNRDWNERLALLEQIDDKIREMCGSHDFHRKVSQTFTALVVERLTNVSVTCLQQAYVYLNSANESHRQAAWAWLVLNEPNNSILKQRQLDCAHYDNKREFVRHKIDLSTTITANDNSFEAKLVDISTKGARLSISTNSITCGTKVEVTVPFLGRVAATVVWIAATFMGLAFSEHNVGAMAPLPG